jgi:hypothetical protein
MENLNPNLDSPSRFLDANLDFEKKGAFKIAMLDQPGLDDDYLIWGKGTPTSDTNSGNKDSRHEDETPKRRRRIPGFSFTPDKVKKTKNIVRNYGNAIAAFAISSLAVPYLNPLLDQEMIGLQEFQTFVSKRKEYITNINNFRALLQEYLEDDRKERAFKRIFREIGEVFVKYFSVNWIFDGKMKYKSDHLKYRGKMLRRIKNPELFTYLKGKT